jgi:hypothetical protein
MKRIALAALLGALVATPSFAVLPNTGVPGQPAASGGVDPACPTERIPGAPDDSVFILHVDRG